MIDLRLGRWEDVLADVEVDAVITDPPYSERTHAGASSEQVTQAPDGAHRFAVTYQAWSASDVLAFVRSWHPRARGWIAALTSHDLCPDWEAAFAGVGRQAFAPLPIVCTNPAPRVIGDGPTNGTVWLMVARPRTKAMATWGSLRAHYLYTKTNTDGGGGRGKPLDLMRALISDYSRPGDLVCDPCAGYGSTLGAAAQKGRKAIGAEVDPAVHAEALVRLSRVQTVDLFAEPRARQAGLL